MILRANDVIGDGELKVYFNPSAPKPFGLEFSRESNHLFQAYECGFNLSRSEAKRLALYILEVL